MRSRLLLFLIVSCLLLGNITATEHDNNLDTPFIPHPTQYSASVTTYFKIDFQETLNFIIDTGSNHFSIVQGAKPFFNSDEKFDVYYRKGDAYIYVVPVRNDSNNESQRANCYKLERPSPYFTLDLLEEWWRNPEEVKYEGEQIALYNMEKCHVWSKDRLDKRVQLFVTEVGNTPVQIIEQNVLARPEWRVVNTFHEFNTSQAVIAEAIKPPVDLSSCTNGAGVLSLVQLLPEALLEIK